MDITDSESSDGESGMLRKALDVQLPEDFDPNSIPQSGEEYLHHVIYERTTKCKKCVTAEGDFSKFTKNQKIQLAEDIVVPKSLNKFYPSSEWQMNAMQDFLQLRNFIRNTGCDVPKKEILNSEPFVEKIQQMPPKFSELIQYSQATKVIMLHQITENLDNLMDRSRGIPDNLGAWIYALLVLLENPLTPDCCFKLRQLAKKCADLRAKLREADDESLALPLNLYVLIIAKYFNQLDLWP